MTQRQISHAPGTLPRCATCERDPKHFEDLRAVRCGGGHALECCGCGRTSGKHASLDHALAAWRQANGYPAVSRPAARVSAFPARQARP